MKGAGKDEEEEKVKCKAFYKLIYELLKMWFYFLVLEEEKNS